MNDLLFTQWYAHIIMWCVFLLFLKSVIFFVACHALILSSIKTKYWCFYIMNYLIIWFKKYTRYSHSDGFSNNVQSTKYTHFKSHKQQTNNIENLVYIINCSQSYCFIRNQREWTAFSRYHCMIRISKVLLQILERNMH